MRIVQRIEQWNSAHQPKWLFVIRVILGLILLVKGIFFISHADQLNSMISSSQFKERVAFLVSYIIFSHLFCGVFIILGLLTRWMVLLQIPILIGAVIFTGSNQGLMNLGSEFWLSLLVLVLLVFFLFEGGGPLSMDNYLKKYLL